MKTKFNLSISLFSAVAVVALLTLTSMKMDKKEPKAFLEITLVVKAENREKAGGVYMKYKNPFLKEVKGAVSKDLLMRSEDVQVLHGFESEEDANNYLSTELFENDVVRELKPYLEAAPEVRIYSVFAN